MKLSELTPNPKNPRTISDDKLAMLKKALHEFGDLSGIVFNRRTGHLVGGHQRVKVLPSDAEIQIDVRYDEPTRTGTIAEGKVTITGEEEDRSFYSESYRYREVDWDKTREKAANIAANQHGGEFDLPMLSEWMRELDAAKIDMDLTGFSGAELDSLLTPIQVLEPGCDEDEVPEVREDPKTKLGDLYQLGRHRLLCGDSTSIDAVEKLMGGEKADMVFTDPPYGMTESRQYFNGTDRQGNYDDESTFDLQQLQLWDCEYVVWGGNYYEWLPEPRNKIGWIVWDKRPSRDHWDAETRASADRRFGQHFEIAVTNVSEMRGKMLRKTWGGYYGTAGDQLNQIVHKTQKPIELAELCLQGRHKSVLDYFGGSGSTLIACEKTNRRCFMMELDPHYTEIIVARWEKYTGQKATLSNGPT